MSKTQAQTVDELQNMFQQYIKDKGFLYSDNKYRCNKDEKIYMDNDANGLLLPIFTSAVAV